MMSEPERTNAARDLAELREISERLLLSGLRERDAAAQLDRQLAFSGAITASLSAQPRYMIEYLGVGTQPFRTGGAKNPQGTTSRVGEHHVYRITARSQGGTDGVVRVTESYYSAMNLTNTNFNPGSP